MLKSPIADPKNAQEVINIFLQIHRGKSFVELHTIICTFNLSDERNMATVSMITTMFSNKI